MKRCFSLIVLLAAAGGMVLAARADTPPRDAPPHTEMGFLDEGPLYEIDPWAMSPEGTLNGITARIPYIADLGVKTIYIMPLFKHEPFITYRVWDYFQLDPGFGTDDDMRRLVKTAHDHGLHVLVDFTVSHTPANQEVTMYPSAEDVEKIRKSGATRRLEQALERVRLIEKARKEGLTTQHVIPADEVKPGDPTEFEMMPWKSPFYDAHPEFIRHDKDGNPLRCFPVWYWGFAPNYDSELYQNYMADVAGFWMRKYDIDGFRIDAPQNNWDPAVFPDAKDATALLRKVRHAVKSVKPEAVLFSERMAPNYGGGAGEGREPRFDEVAEASYQDHVLWYLLGTFLIAKDPKPPTGKTIEAWVKQWPVWYGRSRAHVLETHDFDRIASVAPNRVEQLAVFQFTLPGVPMIFCGQEIGEADKNLVHWDQANEELLELYKKLCRLNREEPVLRRGEFRAVDAPEGLCVYLRSLDGRHYLTALNWGDEEAEARLDLAADKAIASNRVAVREPLVASETREVDLSAPLELSIPARGYRLLEIQEGSESAGTGGQSE